MVLVGTWVPAPAFARGHGKPALFKELLAVDAAILGTAPIEDARGAFEVLVRRASSCVAAGPVQSQDRARCAIDGLFASGEIGTVDEPGEPEASTVTSVIVSHRGNCAALAALALAVAEQAGVPLEAVVFPRHVVVRSPADPDRAFELLQRGADMTMIQTRKRLGADGAHGVRVGAREFLTYYLDNLAVRFAEAGDTKRAESMFRHAIDTGASVARVRFNFGTYLLGANRLDAAREQLERAVRLDSRNAPAWANLGVVVARLGDAGRASCCFERALRIDPGNRIASEHLRALGAPPPR